MNSATVVLSAKGLKKSFGTKLAVNDIDIAMAVGDFLGFLGPNGAGKTTTIKMLTGLIKPTEGQILYYDKDFLKNPIQAKSVIGVVPQQNNVDNDLTAYENLKLHAILYNMNRADREEKIETMLAFSGLQDYRNQKVKTFSGGMKRRLAIVRALLHEPAILFLDEPTIGLDPQIRRSMWDFILKINQSKKTAIFLTTHYIEEAEKLCNQVCIIHQGKIIVRGTPDGLKLGIGQFVLEFYRGDGIDEEFFDTKDEAMLRLQDCTCTCKIREVSLEDVFLKYTGRRINV
ncbi:MAG TPA: ABC transporter ATP-binding protein [Thermodesulfovibrionia bacterium]|nr:ABC transporter ATP-binding protein [Thermodesulfovibrionia bacterium]